MAKKTHPAPGAKSKPRVRDAAATREAILASARQLFSRSGYDGVGVREIAAGAGVTAMMVNRYFGSKEQLFVEALCQTMTGESVIAGGIMDTPAPGLALARAVIRITRPGEVPLDGFRMAAHSASSPVATAVGKQMIESHALATVSAALRGDHASERAALILSMISGFQGMRQMIGLSALVDADEDTLVELLASVFDGLISAKNDPGH